MRILFTFTVFSHHISRSTLRIVTRCWIVVAFSVLFATSIYSIASAFELARAAVPTSNTTYIPLAFYAAPPRIAFTGTALGVGARSQLFITSEDSTTSYQATNDPLGAQEPTWSPNADAIAYVQGGDMSPTGVTTSTLVISTTATSQAHPVLTWIDTGRITRPRWSPDGIQIAFSATHGANTDVYSVHPDGSHLMQLTNDPALDQSPTWSPDSQRLAFVSDRDGKSAIYTMLADGTQQSRLTSTDGYESYPAWSPDGQRLAFFRDYVLEIRDLQTNTDTAIITINRVYDALYGLVWSPTGRRLAFTQAIYRSITITLIEADGSNPRTLLPPPQIVYSADPAWAP
jgi:dipeptidyl aminopeptidase/acylaminoacyl peptidase